MSAMVEHKPKRTAVAPHADSEAFVAMLERASRDPEVDVSKLERLIALQERVMAREAEVAFNAALATMQTELPEMPERGAVKNKSGGVQSRYALWEDINKIIKPILSKHGFALTFRTGNEQGKIIVTGILSHREGHSVSSTFALPVDDSGAKNAVQGLGSSTSYGKRYVAGALLNLTSRGEDDDGAGGRINRLSDEEIADWSAKIDEVTTKAEHEALWSQIVQLTNERGDVDGYSTLKSAAAKRLHAIVGSK